MNINRKNIKKIAKTLPDLTKEELEIYNKGIELGFPLVIVEMMKYWKYTQLSGFELMMKKIKRMIEARKDE